MEEHDQQPSQKKNVRVAKKLRRKALDSRRRKGQNTIHNDSDINNVPRLPIDMSDPIMETSSPSTEEETAEKEAKVISYLSHSRFHHRLTLPATVDHDEVQVAYSVIGAGADDLCDPENARRDNGGSGDIPTILWCGAMLCTRWQAAYNHHLAEEEGVRIVYVDRYDYFFSPFRLFQIDCSLRVTIGFGG